MPSSPTPTPVPDPPQPSRSRASCSPEPHRFANDQPLSHGDTGHGVVDPRIRYLLPIALSPSSRELVGSYRDAVVVWDAATGEVARVLATASWTDVLAWSPDGVEIVTEDADGLERLDSACGSRIGRFDGHTRVVSEAGAARRVTAATFSPDGRRLLSIGADGTLRAWSVADGTQLVGVDVDDPVAVSVSPDGAIVLVTSRGGGASTYSIRDLARGVSFKGEASRWRFLDEATLIGGTPDGRVITVGSDGSGAGERFSVKGAVRDVALSPDGSLAVAMTDDHGAWLAPVDGSVPPRQLERPEYYGGVIGGACFSGDGSTVYVCDQVTGIVAYDPSGTPLYRFTAPSG